MRYAIIAAGEGSRLAAEGITQPKPLVKIGSEAMIDRLIRIFMQNDADEIVVICNAAMPEVASHLQMLQREGLQGHSVPLRYVVKTTPSSMHSFYEISPFLEDRFILTTVDTIFHEDEFADYVRAFNRLTTSDSCDGLMGVTDYIDDEKPLYIGLEEQGTRDKGQGNTCSLITGFYDNPPVPCSLTPAPLNVSAGIYGLTQKSFITLRGCVERGEQRMRNFQRALLRDRLQLYAYPFTKVFDIDHATDIEKANCFVER